MGLGGLEGRDDDVRALLALLDGRTARLVTVVGPGGVGKTALAGAVAATCPLPAVVVDLRAAAAAEEVPALIGRAAGVPTDVGADELDAELAGCLGSGVLLVLDNAEHVRGAGRWLARLLAAMPSPRALVTSRLPLEVPGEHVHRLRPLPPAAAAALFAARARQRGATAGPPEVVEAICRQVDGLPLALELAAGRLDVLTPAALAERLAARPGTLGRAMAASLEVSHELLSPAAQALHRRLGWCSVDVGLPLVEALAGDEPLDVLAELVRASLLERADRGDEPRFRQLVPIREDARARLAAAGEEELAAAAHGRWAALRAAEVGRALDEGDDLDLAALAPDQPELAAAVRWSVAAAEAPGVAAEVVRGCWKAWLYDGRCRDGLALAAAVLEHPAGLAADVEAQVATGAAQLAEVLARWGDAERLAARAVAAARAAGSPTSLVRALAAAGGILRLQGRLAEALPHLEEAARLVEERPAEVAWRAQLAAANNLAAVHHLEGRHGDAADALAACLERFGDRLTALDRCTLLGNLATAQGAAGRLDAVLVTRQANVEQAERLGSAAVLAAALTNLADELTEGRRPADAVPFAERAVAVATGAHLATEELHAELVLAIALGDAGRRPEAVRLLAGVVPRLRDGGAYVHPRALAADVGAFGAGLLPDEVVLQLLVVDGIGGVWPEEAGDRVGEVAWAPSSPATEARRNGAFERVRRRVGEERTAEVLAAGAHLDVAQALDLVVRAVAALPEGAQPDDGPRPGAGPAGLSPRELDVLRLVARGLTDKEVAAELGIALRTATTHVSRILGKLGAPTRTAAAARARELDLL